MAFKDNVAEVSIQLVMVGFFFVIGFGIFEPAILWLGSGTFPERDLFWLIGSPSCESSIWDFFSGSSDACRRSYIEFTEAVGLNKIVNWFFDLPLFFVWLFSTFFLMSLVR
ncbi:hypothetical protein N9A27_07470 [Porticoccaceae bacterium]|nr:hypothetical protein [Porticoccaceae bacterium]